MSDTKLKHVFQVYIRSSLDRVWQSITSAEMTPKYFHNSRVKSEWKIGSSIEYWITDDQGEDRVAVSGEILEIELKTRLQHTFRLRSNEDAHSRVTYELKEIEEMVQLLMIHDGFERETDTYKSVFRGWSWIFSGMKSVLETGEILPLMTKE